jgi:hypothetical protein
LFGAGGTAEQHQFNLSQAPSAFQSRAVALFSSLVVPQNLSSPVGSATLSAADRETLRNQLEQSSSAQSTTITVNLSRGVRQHSLGPTFSKPLYTQQKEMEELASAGMGGHESSGGGSAHGFSGEKPAHNKPPSSEVRQPCLQPDHARNPQSWKRYSLADTPETESNDNRLAALSFLRSVREKYGLVDPDAAAAELDVELEVADAVQDSRLATVEAKISSSKKAIGMGSSPTASSSSSSSGHYGVRPSVTFVHKRGRRASAGVSSSIKAQLADDSNPDVPVFIGRPSKSNRARRPGFRPTSRAEEGDATSHKPTSDDTMVMDGMDQDDQGVSVAESSAANSASGTTGKRGSVKPIIKSSLSVGRRGGMPKKRVTFSLPRPNTDFESDDEDEGSGEEDSWLYDDTSQMDQDQGQGGVGSSTGMDLDF